MTVWKKTLIPQGMTVREAIAVIEDGGMQIAIVVDELGRLLGTVTDGDVRRGILAGIALDRPVEDVMNAVPFSAGPDDGHDAVLALMKTRHILQVPLVDADRRVVGVVLLEELLNIVERDNWVVIMAGGVGSRLRPLTNNTPKPLLNVGHKPLLETILESFVEHGFRKFWFSVNYRAEMIENYFGNGARWGAQIRYLQEKESLGTAGGLGLLPSRPTAPVVVMNGDLLTKINFRQLLDFHNGHHAKATLCVHDYEYEIPYGVVELDGHKLCNIVEKPIQHHFISAGIYVIEPAAFDLIEQGKFLNMPSLFKKLVERGDAIATFPLREYWLDIGQIRDFERANLEFSEVFQAKNDA